MKILLKLVILLFPALCFAQAKSTIIDENGQPINYGVSALQSKIPLFLQTDKNTRSISPFNSINNDRLGSVVFLRESTNVLVTTRVRKDSLDYYRYTIIENDTLIKVLDGKLTKVNFVWNKYSSYPGYLTMDLGISNITGKKITIKIYRFPHAEEVTTLIIYNKPLVAPTLKGVYLISYSDKATPKNPLLQDVDTLKDGKKISLTDKTRAIMLSMQKTDLDFVYNVFLRYKDADGENERMISNNWIHNTDDGNPICNVDVSQFRIPGEYTLIVRAATRELNNKTSNHPAAAYSFTVLSPPLKFSGLFVLIVAVLLLIKLFTIIYFVRKRNKKAVNAANLRTEIFKTSLNSVRAQLNPHFVFNALSGIQNLINKNQVEMANTYLTKFADLTRNILNDDEQISINDEGKLIADYLSMEQLRFPFTFEVNIVSDANFGHTEIPTMLLQPFVENAVKHGVAALKEQGKISVNISKQNKDVVLSVADNGKGFDDLAAHEGLGLKLSKKRIALLNEVYIECPVLLNIKATGNGTRIEITLKNWL